jgi:deazaflavin-dependent oxidoreductase (nitroreductase family)
MPVQIRKMRPPMGLSRLGFRFPISLYRLGLGGLLGKRFVCLTHTGRISGKPRQTVLEVVRYELESGSCVVAAGFGERSDWVRNVTRDPHIAFAIGRIRRDGLAEKLDAWTAGTELVNYARSHPFAWRELTRFMGFQVDGTEEDTFDLGKIIPMFKLVPD